MYLPPYPLREPRPSLLSRQILIVRSVSDTPFFLLRPGQKAAGLGSRITITLHDVLQFLCSVTTIFIYQESDQ